MVRSPRFILVLTIPSGTRTRRDWSFKNRNKAMKGWGLSSGDSLHGMRLFLSVRRSRLAWLHHYPGRMHGSESQLRLTSVGYFLTG
ncbi:hypothetical protein BDV26DRAFT_266283 [Aspergillus bertholletiae]|uniref:Uncharacterized protein n=1 Tax=Aspergillus bertholletiae TaxID=1226010 RepID=A0A5N7B1Z3_9EURO|nr:hypothetical protein BDV26DRAFT_266283 [Aspergillus bertholletiae]